MSEKVPLYDGFGDDYDVMVNWQERLQRESPFLLARLREAGARRVLDVGSATGHHARHLAQLGFAVVGADPSGVMVERARLLGSGSTNPTFVQAGFGSLRSAVEGEVDAVLCLGNTLPHAASQAEMLAAVTDMANLLRPDGVLLIQQLNYDRILAQRQRFLGQTAVSDERGDYLFFRFYDYEREALVFNVLIQKRLPGSDWQWRVESTRLQPILSSQLLATLVRGGFAVQSTFGSYGGEEFDPLASNDLIVQARRAAR